ncbi:angiotensin-converting enzyme-like isoform X2 [Apostichopus japonicus]|uniref:angiotensin-converting enzyme-like isoform X2 n=1 Tax=Stichopus japonicus TaxID=307972 RepID=UPI003AB34982
MKSVLSRVGIHCFLFGCLSCFGFGNEDSLENDAMELLRRYTAEGEVIYADFIESHWNLFTNLTQENQKNVMIASMQFSAYLGKIHQEISAWNMSLLSDETRTQVEMINFLTGTGLNSSEAKEYNQLLNRMNERYSTGSVCQESKCYSFDPDLEQFMATSRDYQDLLWAWHGWRESVANNDARQDYINYTRLSNEGARNNGYEDAGHKLRQTLYRGEDVLEEAARLWADLKPLFMNLHAYVRRKLFNFYGSDVIDITGPIPAHLLGNMHPRAWTNIMDIVIPYPAAKTVDFTAMIKEKNLTGMDMAHMADEFFKSLGMIAVSERFFKDSMFEKPTDGRQVVCYPASFDFFNRRDFRMKMCADANFEDFLILHHEMGHIQYFMQYKDLPLPFRNSPNPAFHEGIGDTIVLSTVTSQHLYTIGLLDEQPIESFETEINFLMQMALDNVAFMPFAYNVDLYRWKVFDGNISTETLNQGWWKLRFDMEGLTPPEERGEDYLDALSYFHIAYDVPHIRYFLSRILTFQFHEALCNVSGQTGPLHQCNIFGSHEAGDLFSELLSGGSKLPWDDSLEIITGTRRMTVEPFLKYFKPLEDWLNRENERNGDVIGWGPYNTGISSHYNASSLTRVFLVSFLVFILRP